MSFRNTKYVNVKSTRISGKEYTNDTPFTRVVQITVFDQDFSPTTVPISTLTVENEVVASSRIEGTDVKRGAGYYHANLTAIVAPGETYFLTLGGNNASIYSWVERLPK